MKVPVWLVVLITCFSCNMKPRPVDLRLRPETGQVWSVNTHTINTSNEQSGTYSDTLDFDFDLVLLKADSSGGRFQMLLRNLQHGTSPRTANITIKNGTVSTAYSLDEFYANRQKIYNSIENDTLFLVISSTGTLLMEDGYDRLAARLAMKSEVEPATVKTAIHHYLGSAALSDFFKEMFFYLPADDILSRPVWVSNTVFTAMAPVKHSNLIRMKSLAEGKVLAEVEAQVSAGEDGSRYLTGTKNGLLNIDQQHGVLISLEMKEQSTIHMTGAERKITKTTVIMGSLK